MGEEEKEGVRVWGGKATATKEREKRERGGSVRKGEEKEGAAG